MYNIMQSTRKDAIEETTKSIDSSPIIIHFTFGPIPHRSPGFRASRKNARSPRSSRPFRATQNDGFVMGWDDGCAWLAWVQDSGSGPQASELAWNMHRTVDVAGTHLH